MYDAIRVAYNGRKTKDVAIFEQMKLAVAQPVGTAPEDMVAGSCDGSNLSHIFGLEAINMLKDVINWIKSMYEPNARTFIKRSLLPSLIDDNDDAATKKAMREKVFRVQNLLLVDGVQDLPLDLAAIPTIAAWWATHVQAVEIIGLIPRAAITAEDWGNNYNFDQQLQMTLDLKPEKFLAPLLYISNRLEVDYGGGVSTKHINFAPQHVNPVQRHIMIDTASLIGLFPLPKGNIIPPSKATLNGAVREYAPKVWSSVFNMRAVDQFAHKKEIFSHVIQTDGYSVSFLYMGKKQAENKDNEYNNRQGKRAANQALPPAELEAANAAKSDRELAAKKQKTKHKEDSKVANRTFMRALPPEERVRKIDGISYLDHLTQEQVCIPLLPYKLSVGLFIRCQTLIIRYLLVKVCMSRYRSTL